MLAHTVRCRKDRTATILEAREGRQTWCTGRFPKTLHPSFERPIVSHSFATAAAQISSPPAIPHLAMWANFSSPLPRLKTKNITIDRFEQIADTFSQGHLVKWISESVSRSFADILRNLAPSLLHLSIRLSRECLAESHLHNSTDRRFDDLRIVKRKV